MNEVKEWIGRRGIRTSGDVPGMQKVATEH